MVNKRGLGRGLSALIPSFSSSEEIQFEEIAVANIRPNPHQPRKHFNGESFEELVDSVREFGLVQPIVVRPQGDSYILVAGERRWRAAKEAGLKTIPAIVRNSDELRAMEMALVENLQREDLNALEEANAYRVLIEQFNLTQEELAERVGKSRVAITNTLRLLQLPIDIQGLIVEGSITSGHAKALLQIKDVEGQRKLAAKIISEGLSVRQTENISRLWGSPKLYQEKRVDPKAFKAIAKHLGKMLSAKVRIKLGAKRGKIEIDFISLEDLERLVALITEKVGQKEVFQPYNYAGEAREMIPEEM